ncbi:RluA family pseudouridine synthase [Pediococcus acidilactici]|uniref:RluA family pseudouridine synthase n=1 Tax=Pediococcus acidilactici TaxID=1254 RepID=UPI003A9337B1
MKFSWQVQDESPQHLRTFLTRKRISRALLKSIKFNGGKILVNEQPKRTNAMVTAGDQVTVELPPEPGNPHVVRSRQPIDVIYEDQDYLVVNKPPFLPTVQSARNQTDTLVNRVKNYYAERDYESQVVHVVTRLDQDTSGLVLFAKHRFAHTIMDQDLRQHRVQKYYLAMATGRFAQSHGLIDAPIERDPASFIKRRVASAGNGKPSKTEYWVLEQTATDSLLKVQLHTGRTHQIRVHFSELHHLLIGDPLYNETSFRNLQRQALHCFSLKFENVFRGKKIDVQAPIPNDMLEYWKKEKDKE